MLGDREWSERLYPITAEITGNIYERAYRDHSLVNEAENGVIDTTRVWWVQAEAIVGFVNGYEKAAEDIWNYIKGYIIDPREHSEWFWAVDENHVPLPKPIVEPWKCPYHNGRMCMEVIRRMSNAS